MHSQLRWTWQVCAGLAAAFCLAAAGLAQDTGSPTAGQQQLRWKFTPGQKFQATQTQKMNTEMNFGDQVFRMTMNMDMNLRWQIDAVQDGSAKMSQTIDRVKLEMSMNDQSLKFDSATPDDADPASRAMGQAMQPLVGAKVTQTMDPRGKVADIQFDPELRKKLEEASQVPGGGISEESLKQMGEQMGSLPEQAVAPGATWSETVELPMPGGKPVGMKIDSTFRGMEERNGRQLARIDLKFSLAAAPAAANAGEPAEKKDDELSAEIKSLDGTGRRYFDVEAGHLVEGESEMAMTTAVDVGGQKIDQKIVANSRLVIEPAP